MEWNMDEDIKGIIKALANKYEMDVEDYYNTVLLCGLYYEQNMKDDDWIDLENYFKGIKDIPIDYEIPENQNWFK